MADINVERKRRSVWPLLLALLLVAAIAVGAWYYLGNQNGGGVSDTAPAAELQNSPDGTTAPPPGATDPYGTPGAGATTPPAEPGATPPPTTSGY